MHELASYLNALILCTYIHTYVCGLLALVTSMNTSKLYWTSGVV